MAPIHPRNHIQLLVGAIVIVGIGAVLTSQIFTTSENARSDTAMATTSDSDITSGNGDQRKAEVPPRTEQTMSAGSSVPNRRHFTSILKDVGEAAYNHFGLTKADFLAIKQEGFDIIEGNFDICANDEDVRFFLDSAEKVGLKVILSAGAGEAEWGYSCDDNFAPGQKPLWQREKVRAWVDAWKNHKALYAWDTGNEDGGTFPFGTGGVNPDPEWETKYALSAEQLQEAHRDVKDADPVHPIMIRMNGWYFYDNVDNFFRAGNAFGPNVADIVMVNAYSNVDEYYPDFVSTVLRRAARSLYAIDPHVKVVPALGVWNEAPVWVKPSTAHLVNDYNQALKAENLLGVAFFKYGARAGNDWFLPDLVRGDPKLWQTIRELIKNQ